MKQTIIVVECISSGINYINDIRKEGFEPVALEIPVEESRLEESRYLHDLYFVGMDTEKPMTIQASPDYRKTLEMVKALNPVLVLAGSDEGIELSLRLSNDLGLPSNKLEQFALMRDKFCQQEALAAAGIRYIRSKIIDSFEDACDFYKEQKNGFVVVKPIIGGATIGVRVCHSKEELRAAVDEDFALFNNNRDTDVRIMVQEFIDGEEFIVNSVSCHGKHTVTSMFKSDKILIPGFGPAYDCIYAISPSSPGAEPIWKYAVDVLNALDIMEGAVHSEFMIDSRGPVLIEANCRICGAMMKAAWLDRFLPHHETDLVLKALLRPEEFLNHRVPVISTTGEAMLVFLIVNEDTFVKENKAGEVFGKLNSFFDEFDYGGDMLYHKTIDLSTMGGIIYLASKDSGEIAKDREYIRKINAEHSDKYLCK